jgi:hypothetical protein
MSASGPLLHCERTPPAPPGLFVDTRLPLATSHCKQASRAPQLGLRDRAQRVIIVVTASSTVVDLNVAGEHKITAAIVARWRKPVARALPAPLALGFGLSVFTVRLARHSTVDVAPQQLHMSPPFHHQDEILPVLARTPSHHDQAAPRV